MAKFSLILATYDRVHTLPELFESVVAQTGEDVECIVIDQNQDDRLQAVVDVWRPRLDIRVVRATPQLSKARNLGMAAAKGDILVFPDDDCWYSPGLFKQIREFFEQHPQYGFLGAGVTDKEGIPSGNRWIQAECEIAPVNVFRTSATHTLFFRNTPALAAIRFDERIGPNSGTPFACGEDTDYVLQAMHAGIRGYFKRAFLVHHARRDMLSGNVGEDRAVGYGRGMGHVMRKHKMRALWAMFLLYDVARAAICRLTNRGNAAALCLAHARGVKEGYMAGYPVPEAAS
ncbi:glycosyltransferase family 2 protein [Acidipila sp. EB88]|uniref:glycosyltransferase family 2 protein n=1 Tax=Acidipila sp. EB88 TaxID=2305226 RepID=UPI001315646D|nr:glycosyltransferase family 2 protein [Acidipila sp. EB88]